MKKLSILAIALLLVSGLAFGADVAVEPAATITGSASVTFGVDLNTNYTGFQNAGSGTLTVTLVPEQDITVGGDDGLYGEIMIEAFKFENGVATSGTASAKIVVSPLEVKIYAAPGFAMNEAAAIDVDTPDVETALANVNGTSINGITITVPVDPITLAVKVASDGDWTENADNEYVLGADVDVAVDPITIGLGLTYGWFGAPQLGISATADVALDVVEGLDLGVAFDGNQPDGGDFAFDVRFDTTLGLTADNDDDESADVTLGVYFAPYAATDDNDLDLAIGFSEPEAGGLMEMLYASVAAEIHDLLGPADIAWLVDVSGGYDTGDIDPYFGFGYGSDEIFDLNVGVYLKSGLTGIDNTEIQIDYTSTDLETDSGILFVKTTVSF